MKPSSGLKENAHSWMASSWGEGGHDGTGSGLILRFLPTDSSLTPQQMVGVGLGSVAFVTVLAFLSSSAVWYVGPSLLKNEWNGGEARVGVMPNSWA